MKGFGKSVDKNTAPNLTADVNRINKDRAMDYQEKTYENQIAKESKLIHKNEKESRNLH